jgi:hypothetical protein
LFIDSEYYDSIIGLFEYDKLKFDEKLIKYFYKYFNITYIKVVDIIYMNLESLTIENVTDVTYIYKK